VQDSCIDCNLDFVSGYYKKCDFPAINPAICNGPDYNGVARWCQTSDPFPCGGNKLVYESLTDCEMAINQVDTESCTRSWYQAYSGTVPLLPNACDP
jgi:hypothetical protein